MKTHIPVRNAVLAVYAARLDAALSPGVLRIYTGTAPTDAGAVTEQRLLVALPLHDPCYSSIEFGSMVLATIPEQMVTNSGTVGWARLVDGDGNTVGDLTVGIKDQPTIGTRYEIELPTMELIAGAYLRITGATIHGA